MISKDQQLTQWFYKKRTLDELWCAKELSIFTSRIFHACTSNRTSRTLTIDNYKSSSKIEYWQSPESRLKDVFTQNSVLIRDCYVADSGVSTNQLGVCVRVAICHCLWLASFCRWGRQWQSTSQIWYLQWWPFGRRYYDPLADHCRTNFCVIYLPPSFSRTKQLVVELCHRAPCTNKIGLHEMCAVTTVVLDRLAS